MNKHPLPFYNKPFRIFPVKYQSKKSKQLIILLAMVLSVFNFFAAKGAITSTGNEFWFCYMQNIDEAGRIYDLKIFISSDKAASGTVEIPGQSWSSSFSVAANSTTVITVPTAAGHVIENDVAVRRGVHITSDQDINVFAMNYSAQTTDGSLILPNTAIGNDYYIMTYTPLFRSEFAIVAIEDGTTVRIIPAAATIGGKAAGTPYDITLNKGEVYQVQSTGDLTGSRVYSTGARKKIAVFGGATCVKIPPDKVACNHLFEQMFPNNTIRRNFVAVPLKTRLNGDTYRVLAIRNGTTVTFNGASPVNLNAGQFFETIIKDATFISANYPILVAQYSNGTGYDNVADTDPFFIMLSPVEQTREDITFEVFNLPTITGNYVNVSAKTSCTSQITLDGSPIAGWNTVAGNPVYSWVQMSVTQGPHRLLSAKDCGFNAYVYGYGNADSYGYSAGVQLDTLGISLTTNTDCAGKGTEFYVASYPYPIVTYSWDFGDGGSSAKDKPTHIYQNGGSFTVKLIVTYDNGDKDTVTSQFSIIEPAAKGSFKGGKCVNDVIAFQHTSTTIGGGSISSILWDFADGGTSKNNSENHSFTKPGTYKVVLFAYTSNGCVDTDTLSVKINPLPVPVITPSGPTTFCSCDSVILDAGNLGYTSYLWTSGEKTQKITVRKPGNYTVTVIDTNGCTGSSAALAITVIYPSSEVSLGSVPVSAAPGEMISIPLLILNSAFLDRCNIRNFHAIVSYNKTLLATGASTPAGVMTGPDRIIDFTGTRGATDTLAILKFEATLGNAESTKLNITKFEWTDCPIPDSIKTRTNTFTLNDLCKAGGITRLYNYEGVPTSLNISPNPAGESANVDFSLGESGITMLSIYDILGNNIKTLQSGPAEKGVYQFNLSTEAISNGLYFFVLKTETKVITKSIEVRK